MRKQVSSRSSKDSRVYGLLRTVILLLLCLAFTPGGILLRSTAFADDDTIPVAPQVLIDLQARGEAEFFIVLKAKGDTQQARLLESKPERGAFVYGTLRNTAVDSQKDIVEWLDQQGIPYRRYWIVNQILVKGDAGLLSEVLKRHDVARIDANPSVRFISDPQPAPAPSRISAPVAVEWGVQRIHADAVWSTYGVKGEGIVVAGQDTGVEWNHPALISHYRGWDGSSADHNYNWHDAIHSASGNPCGSDSPFPCDDYDHGTHTMGTMVGDDGGANQIGVAPGAKWIACRNMDSGLGSPATYTECFEWFMAPYPLGGDPLTDGDPTKAPHVINNSWGCPPSEGCSQDSLENIVAAVRDAGIMVVVSNGNSGSACATTYDPPSLYEESFSVGATDSSDGLASFSSRGPVTYKGKTYRKPDIAAPGVNVRSSVRGGLYRGMSGTSIAAPHVAGSVALLWSAVPSLKGKVDLTENILELTAFPKDFTLCGDLPGVPNNGYGYGIVDVINAIRSSTTPFITGVTPDPFGLGETVAIQGLNFGTKKPVIHFGSVKGKVLTWSTTLITCSFSKGAAGPQDLVVTANKVASNSYSCTLSAPVIEPLVRHEGSPGTQVTLSGEFFGVRKPKVLFNPEGGSKSKSAKVFSLAPYDTSVGILVPKVPAGAYEIRLQNGTLISEPMTYTVLPPPPKP